MDATGKGAFGFGGSARFIGFLSLDGCFAGKWVDYGTDPMTSGIFVGSKQGSGAKDCDTLVDSISDEDVYVLPDTDSPIDGVIGKDVGGELTIESPHVDVFGTSFTPVQQMLIEGSGGYWTLMLSDI